MDKNDKKNISGAQFSQQPDEFQVRSASSGIKFDYDNVQPILGRYVGVDDFLQLNSAANSGANVITVNVRVLNLDGKIIPFKFTQFTSGGGNTLSNRFQLMEGWILSATVSCSAQPNSQFYCYAQLSLTRTPFSSSDNYDVLCQGFVYQNFPLAFPASPARASTDGAGIITTVTGLAPGAGAEWVQNPPPNTRIRLISVSFLFATSATVANRFITLAIKDGVGVFLQIPILPAQVAGTTVQYEFADSICALNNTNGIVATASPSNLFIPAGFQLASVTQNIQAGDTYAAPRFCFQMWPDAV